MPAMPNATAAENREYDGSHDATEVLVADGVYVAVLNKNVTDEQADALGYTLDDTDVSGKTFVRRSITVSGAFAALLPVESFPRIGGSASADNAVDASSHPALREYELDSGEVVSAAELNERVRIAAEADDAADRADADAGDAQAAADLRERQLARSRAIAARLGELDDALDSAEGDDADKITAERKELADELDALRKELG